MQAGGQPTSQPVRQPSSKPSSAHFTPIVPHVPSRRAATRSAHRGSRGRFAMSLVLKTRGCLPLTVPSRRRAARSLAC